MSDDNTNNTPEQNRNWAEVFHSIVTNVWIWIGVLLLIGGWYEHQENMAKIENQRAAAVSTK